MREKERDKMRGSEKGRGRGRERGGDTEGERKREGTSNDRRETEKTDSLGEGGRHKRKGGGLT
jgi:hypothetical protein